MVDEGDGRVRVSLRRACRLEGAGIGLETLRRAASRHALPRAAHFALAGCRSSLRTRSCMARLEVLLIQGIEPLLSALEVLATLEARARLPGSYPWARIEALYLHNRLTRSIKARGDDVASSVSFSFSWPTQWRPLAHREIYELVHAVFFLSDFGCNRWEPGRDALLPHLAALNRSLGLAAKFCMGTGQLDLISEVALAMMCLDGRANVSQLIGALGAAQNLDGAIASRRHAHTVRDLYHATLVALLALCRVELQSTGSFFFSLPDPAASIK